MPNTIHTDNIKEGEGVKQPLAPKDIEMILALIDLMFIAQDEGRVTPS